jgi:acyl phosphate:glycerol-3-phosphate acyltransferase
VYRPLLVFASYLLGTFPTARLVVGRAIEGGSGNPGASNAFRTGGRAKGALVLLGDGAKGAVATAIPLLTGQGRPLAMACGAAAVLGHVLPLTRPTRGGKGVATAAGMAAVLFPAPALAAAALWAVTAKLTNTASVASLAATAALPVGAALTRRPATEVLATAAIATLVFARHARNLSALARGEERSLQ